MRRFVGIIVAAGGVVGAGAGPTTQRAVVVGPVAEQQKPVGGLPERTLSDLVFSVAGENPPDKTARRFVLFKGAETELAGLQEIGDFGLAELMEFREAEGNISLLLDGRVPEGGSWFKLADGSGFVKVEVDRGDHTGREKYVPLRVTVVVFRWDEARAVGTRTEVLWEARGGSLQIVRNTMAPGSQTMVRLLQPIGAVIDPSVEGGEALKFAVVQSGPQAADGSEKTLVNLSMGATDFRRLRAQFPSEVAVYLRPVFEGLQNEMPLFGADARTAWQVLAPEVAAEAAFAGKVDSILARLDSEKFAERAAAQAELQAMGQPAVQYLRGGGVDRKKLSEQQNSEVDSFLAAFSPLTGDESKSVAKDPDFLIDCLLLDEVALRRAAWARLRTMVPGESFDLDAQAGKRAEQVAVLRAALRKSLGASLGDSAGAAATTQAAPTRAVPKVTPGAVEERKP